MAKFKENLIVLDDSIEPVNNRVGKRKNSDPSFEPEPSKKKRKTAFKEDFNGSSGDECDYSWQQTVYLLCGPTGVGKTSLVYTLANELNFKVFEMGCSSRRSGKDVLGQLQTTFYNNHITVEAANRFDKVAALFDYKPVIKTAKRASQRKKPANAITNFFKSSKQKEASPKTPVEIKPVLSSTRSNVQVHTNSIVLFDDVDILMEEYDKGFWPAVNNLIARAKRPIIFTSSNPKVFSDFIKYPQNMCLIDKHLSNSPVIKRLSKKLEKLKIPNSIVQRTLIQTQCIIENINPQRSNINEYDSKQRTDPSFDDMLNHFSIKSELDLFNARYESCKAKPAFDLAEIYMDSESQASPQDNSVSEPDNSQEDTTFRPSCLDIIHGENNLLSFFHQSYDPVLEEEVALFNAYLNCKIDSIMLPYMNEDKLIHLKRAYKLLLDNISSDLLYVPCSPSSVQERMITLDAILPLGKVASYSMAKKAIMSSRRSSNSCRFFQTFTDASIYWEHKTIDHLAQIWTFFFNSNK
ncbi:ATPase AAA domain-containing protein 5 [Cichlidogyrus casuarinus]|uniref:ATPase AAA domain-containing protein 5 n=1 Tax=Cichlidogyrus casuarinus TaxID=1844966 RepID=A0ABD2QHT9_9PLAT